MRDGATTRLPRGRRPTMVGLNDNLVMFAADIRPKLATVAIVDLNGRFLSRAQLPVSSDPEKAIAAIIEAMMRMKQDHPTRSYRRRGDQPSGACGHHHATTAVCTEPGLAGLRHQRHV